MEKISIQSSYTQLSLYAKATFGPPPPPKPGDGQPVPAVKPDDGADGKPGSNGTGLVARNGDGDTFTLSVEARAIQISRKITIETTNDGDTCGQPLESNRLSGNGQIDALMEALDPARAQGRGHAHHHHRVGHFPQLGDAEDLLAKLKGHWDKEHAAQGGSKQDFAEAVSKRLAAWKAKGDAPATAQGATRVSVAYQEFRTEVSIRITGSLQEWTSSPPASASSGDAPAAEAPFADPSGPSLPS